MKDPVFPTPEPGKESTVEQFGLSVEGEGRSPLFAGKQIAENFEYPWTPGRKAYGALPNYHAAAGAVEVLEAEAPYFLQTYQT